MTIRELAQLIEVSPATISLVLNGKEGVAGDTRKKVWEAVRKYNYQHTTKKMKKSSAVLLLKYHESGMLVEENQGFISMIVDAIESELYEEGYQLNIMAIKSDFERSISKIDYKQWRAVIIIGSELRRYMYESLQKLPLPFVVVDNTVPNYPYSSVCMNNHENVYMALEYCKSKGHKEMGYLRSSSDFENFIARDRAFKLYSKELDIKFEQEYEFRVRPNLVGAYEDMKAILRSGFGNTKLPSCFFADNDTIALGVIKALKEENYRIPEDISIIGFDDIAYASVSSPALTTIRVQRDLIGKQAVKQVLNLIEEPSLMPIKSYISGSIIERSSVRKIEN